MQTIFSGTLLFATLFLATASPSAAAAERRSLMGMIAEWRYPESAISRAEMADGATINSNGGRTVQSLVCKTVMTTDAPVIKVIKYYKDKLKPKWSPGSKKDKPKADSGRSVMFHDDSEGRPFSMHVITVNSERSSTTLVITRGDNETKTYIAWKHYARF